MNEFVNFVVLVGNPVDGLTVHGPFTNPEDATAYAEVEFKHDDWWVHYTVKRSDNA